MKDRINDSVLVRNGLYVHKQIEVRNNRIFMRMKTRKLIQL